MKRLALLLALSVRAATPAAADASTAYMDENGVATAEGEPGQANDMTVRAGGDGVIFTDTAGIRPTSEFCRPITDTEVTCSGPGAGILLGRDGIFAEVIGRRGKTIVSSRFVNFSLTK